MEIDLGRLIDALPGLVWTALPDGGAEYVGKRWLEYTGLGFDEAGGAGWMVAIHPEDAPRLLAAWNDIIASGQIGEVEARMRRFDGVYRWFLFRACPMPEPSGEVLRWCGMNFDIEDHRRAEDALLANEHRFQEIIDGLPAKVGLFEATGPISFSNRHMLEYYDQTLEQLKRGPSGHIYHPDERSEVLKRWAISLRTGQNFDFEARLLRADGVYRWHQVSGFPLRNAAGEIELWYGLFTDIDDARRADAILADERRRLETSEAELKEAHRHLTEAQRLSRTGSFTLDFGKNGLLWSDELYRIFGFNPGTTITLDVVKNVVHPLDLPAYVAMVEGALAGLDIDLAYRIVTPSGDVKHVRAVGHRVEHVADRPVFIGAVQDVTDREIAEAALSGARAELAHVARVTALGALTASIAHEVNQPLAGIVTNASTCLRMLAADPPNVEGARATAQRTIRDGNRASEVIQRLRGLFARRAPAFESVCLNDAIREVIALSSLELQRRRVIVRTAFADDLPPVQGDRVQLQQVILNLVMNAADAMDAVEDRPRDLWLATTRDEAGEATLSVRDSGVGFGPQGLGRLFDAFYTTKPEGMGIGLSISRSIIESHEGRLWATANEGPGATFAFSIPGRRGSAPDGEDPATHVAAAPVAPVVREA